MRKFELSHPDNPTILQCENLFPEMFLKLAIFHKIFQFAV